MSNAFNLSQLANNVNTSGQVSASAGISGTLPIANGGTNNASLAVTAGGVLYTDGSKVVNVGAGTSGQVLTSAGASAPTWASASGGGGFGGQTVFTSNGTFTIPSGKTVVKVTVVGAGGAGAGLTTSNFYQATGGGGGGAAIKYLTGLTPGNTLTVTVGAAQTGGTGNGGTGGTSSVASGTQTITTISATGGTGGVRITGSSNAINYQAGSAGGAGSNGDYNITGQTSGFSQQTVLSCGAVTATFSGYGGNSIMGFGGAGQSCSTDATSYQLTRAGFAGQAYGGGGSGAISNTQGAANGGNSTAGIVIFEY